jgi:hypothetical protein
MSENEGWNSLRVSYLSHLGDMGRSELEHGQMVDLHQTSDRPEVSWGREVVQPARPRCIDVRPSTSRRRTLTSARIWMLA